MSTVTNNTKVIVQFLSYLADKDFVVQNVDWETGEMKILPPHFAEVAVAAKAAQEAAQEAAKAKEAKKSKPHPVYGLVASEIALLMASRPIDAIKAVRERTNLGLADAKALVDRYREDAANNRIQPD